MNMKVSHRSVSLQRIRVQTLGLLVGLTVSQMSSMAEVRPCEGRKRIAKAINRRWAERRELAAKPAAAGRQPSPWFAASFSRKQGVALTPSAGANPLRLMQSFINKLPYPNI